MRILSPPRRTSITGATFSRASEAYDSLGRIALPGLPRLEYVKGVGWVTWVEEASSNLIPLSKQKFVGWLSYSGATVTLTQNQAVSEWGAKDATRIQSSSGASVLKYYYAIELPAAGASRATSVYVKNIGATAVTIMTVLGGKSVTVASGEAKICKLESMTGNGTSESQIQFRTANVEDSLDIIAWHPKSEAKAYCTLFTDASRAAESLTMPTTGLSVTEGTIEGIVEINDVSKRQISGQNQHIFLLERTGGVGIRIVHQSSSAYWTLQTRDSVAYTPVNFSDSLTPNGLYYYKARWSTSEAVVEFWNLSSKIKNATATISNPNLPSDLTKCTIGGEGSSTNFLNTRFGKHRLSNIARTADPDFANLMPSDANTVGIFDPTPVYNHIVR